MPEDALFMGRYPARARHRAGLRALIAERREGKTTQLIRWLLDGEPIEPWPSWSRLLVVADSRRYAYILDNFGAENRELSARGCPGGLGKVLIGAEKDDFSLQRLRLADVEIAVDDAEELIARQLGFMPDVVSMTATPFQSVHEPYKDSRGVMHLWYVMELAYGHVNHEKLPCALPLCMDYRPPTPATEDGAPG